MRIAVTGGRNYDDYIQVKCTAEAVYDVYPEAILVHGDANGADSLMKNAWLKLGGKVEDHPADWIGKGRAAGPIRNQEMVDSGLDLLVVFPGGTGTAHMTDRCKKAGVPVVTNSLEFDEFCIRQNQKEAGVEEGKEL